MRVLGFPKFSLLYLTAQFCNVSFVLFFFPKTELKQWPPCLPISPSLALATQVALNKEFQLADWRLRPLSADMLQYAREDTHYLLYIKDRLVCVLVICGLNLDLGTFTHFTMHRSDLVSRGNEQANLIRSVYTRSTEVCLKTCVIF